MDIAAMPATHVGMLLAPFVVVATDFSWGARNPVGALARTGELLLEMLAAEIVVLFLWAGTLSAGFMMVAMTGAMGAFAGAKSVAIAQCRSASEDGKPERALTGV
ncbi:hypothetical protein [Paraburkholderia sp. 35.1]|uniref:hypothetical protein n=1 Tax=Paraburkholderia sp. 35.1 TaxID=2991058 RepID=UPI003D19B290